jgi:hypothetical protein
MKYRNQIEIELTMGKVAELWNNQSYFNQWQDGFISKELIEGVPETIGAKSGILLKQGKRKMELIETIEAIELPQMKRVLVEHIHMTNTMPTTFITLDTNKTRIVSEIEYTKFNGFLPKLMAKLFPSMFKKKSQKWLDQFKYFAENHTFIN